MREMCSKCWTPFGLKVGPDRLLFHAAVLLLILTVIYTFVVGVGAVFYLTGSPEVSADRVFFGAISVLGLWLFMPLFARWYNRNEPNLGQLPPVKTGGLQTATQDKTVD
jgi:membrane protein implicated in regulation of membrane protease activity